MPEEPYPTGWLSSSPAPAAPQPPARRRAWKGAGLVAAGLVAGGVLAGALSASAASGSSSSSSSASSGYSTTAPSQATPPANAQSSTPVRGDEKSLSTSVAATLTQKAEAKVPGATVYRVETDAGDAAYEAHMKKSDGTFVTVKFDKNYNVTAVEDGMGKGDPAPAGGMGPGGPQGARPGSGSGSTTG